MTKYSSLKVFVFLDDECYTLLHFYINDVFLPKGNKILSYFVLVLCKQRMSFSIQTLWPQEHCIFIYISLYIKYKDKMYSSQITLELLFIYYVCYRDEKGVIIFQCIRLQTCSFKLILKFYCLQYILCINLINKDKNNILFCYKTPPLIFIHTHKCIWNFNSKFVIWQDLITIIHMHFFFFIYGGLSPPCA